MSALLKRPKLTQKEIVLKMLEEAGDRGCHSFEFIQAQLPRVAARVCELRAEGHEIISEHELLHGSATGVRYKLVGVGARPSSEKAPETGPSLSSGASVDSSQELFPQTPYEHMQDAS